MCSSYITLISVVLQSLQNCGNGLPLEGGHCVQCINSSKFSKYGDRCYPCSICVERVVAVRCNGVNDTVCGDTCNVG